MSKRLRFPVEDLPDSLRMFYSEAGKIGGKAKVKKGFAMLSAKQRQENAKKAVAARRKKRESA